MKAIVGQNAGDNRANDFVETEFHCTRKAPRQMKSKETNSKGRDQCFTTSAPRAAALAP